MHHSHPKTNSSTSSSGVRPPHHDGLVIEQIDRIDKAVDDLAPEKADVRRGRRGELIEPEQTCPPWAAFRSAPAGRPVSRALVIPRLGRQDAGLMAATRLSIRRFTSFSACKLGRRAFSLLWYSSSLSAYRSITRSFSTFSCAVLTTNCSSGCAPASGCKPPCRCVAGARITVDRARVGPPFSPAIMVPHLPQNSLVVSR